MAYKIPDYVVDRHVRRRIRIECRVMRRLLKECRKAGFVAVRVWDGESQVPVRSDDSVLRAVNAVDDATIHFAPVTDKDDWGHRGVWIVMGNDNGYECISDWHCGDKKFNAAVNATTDWATELDAGVGAV